MIVFRLFGVRVPRLTSINLRCRMALCGRWCGKLDRMLDTVGCTMVASGLINIGKIYHVTEWTSVYCIGATGSLSCSSVCEAHD